MLDVYRSLPRPYHFNLNAATVVDLRTVPGVEVGLAARSCRIGKSVAGLIVLRIWPVFRV